MSIADNIKKLRESHGLNQIEFGRIAGVSDKAVSTWENGLKVPRMGAVQKLADHFGIPKSDILDDGADPAVFGRRMIAFDDFTFAMQNETKDLTDMDKQILLSMARQLNDARKKKNGETG